MNPNVFLNISNLNNTIMNNMKKTKETPPGFKISDFEDKSLLIVDDDDPFRDRLSRALEKKGFQPKGAKSVEIAVKLIKSYLQ